MTLPDWADAYRRLSSASSAFGGRWRTSRFEIARGPMMAVTEKGVRAITFKSSTQIGKSSLLENVLGYHAHLKPSPMLLVFPKAEMVKSFSKERLGPMARVTPVLGDLLTNDRLRGGGDTLAFREFPGGFLALESAGSPTNLASRAIQLTLCDEIDKYETTREGDPVLLAEERTRTYTGRELKIRTCSPTDADTSRIDKSYKEGDQRMPFVACPHCQHEQTLDFFRHVQWGKSDDGLQHYPYTAAIYCEDCGAEWEETQRLKIMTTRGAIKWNQTRPFECCGVKQEPLKTRVWERDEVNQVGLACCSECGKRKVPNEHASFATSQLYSPVATVAKLAKEWLEWKDDPDTRMVFFNTRLGQAYSAQAIRKVEHHALASRREQYPATVPAGVLVLTAGIDVQAGGEANIGRIEIEVAGWGVGEESWSIEHKVIHGNPAQPDVWCELDDYLLKGFAHKSGVQIRPYGVCIDSGGHNSEEVYKFARARIGRNVWAIKGAADRSGQWSPVWPIPKQEPGKTRLTGYRPVMLGVNAGKEAVRQRLLVEEVGPGYCHFPIDRHDNWFEQLTSENLIIEKKGGFSVRRWVATKGRANEALDCRVYAYGALCGLYAMRKLSLAKLAVKEAYYLPGTFNLKGTEPKPQQAPDAGTLIRPASVPAVRRSPFMA